MRRTALSVLLVSLLIAATTFATKAYRHSIPPVKSRAITLTPEKLAPSTFAKTVAETSAREKSAYGKLPLTFELNQGQADSQVKFLSRGKGYNLFLTGTEAALNLRRGEVRKGDGARGRNGAKKFSASALIPHPSSLIRLHLVHANLNAEITGLDELPGKSNYFLGNDPNQWRTNVANYRQVKYAAVYPGIDQIYYGNQQQLEYDFVVAPHADPGVIALHFDGATKMRLNKQGDLELFTPAGKVVQHQPNIYQTINGVKVTIAGRYVLQAKNTITFALGEYNKSEPLMIDPQLTYSTYLGGAGNDSGNGIAVDAAGNAYVTGETASAGSVPFQSSLGGNCTTCKNVFVTKYDAAGTTMLYSAYFGGNKTSRGQSIAVDANGNAYITGFTVSSNFPVSSPTHPYQSAKADMFQEAGDIFVTKLNATGSSLLYSTYLGGVAYEEAFGIAVDAAGNAYVTGQTTSYNFPLKAALQGYKGSSDVIVTKLNANGSDVLYSTCLGSPFGQEAGKAIAVDTDGNAYITGSSSVNAFYYPETAIQYAFPTTPNAFKTTLDFYGTNAFVAKLNNTGTALLYATYLGGNGYSSTFASGIAIDSERNAYVTGTTSASNFPTTEGAYQKDALLADSTDLNNVVFEGFVTKLNPSGSGLVYSTYLVGAAGKAIAVDANGHAFITGGATDKLPIEDAVQPIPGDMYGADAFVTEFDTAGESLLYSTFLGGSELDEGKGIAVDTEGNAYVTGITYSPDFPIGDSFPAAVAATESSASNKRNNRAVRAGMMGASVQPTSGGQIDGFISKAGPPCALPTLKNPAPENAAKTITPSTVGSYGGNGGWSMQYAITGRDGLNLYNVKLGVRPMAEIMSLPYYVIKTNKMTQEERGELMPKGVQNSLRSRLVDFQYSTLRTTKTVDNPYPDLGYFRNRYPDGGADSDTLVLEATYAVDNIPNSQHSCLLITQRYEFANAGKGCEPSRQLPCARFFPMVQYKFFGGGGEKLEYINFAQRNHFRPDGSFKNVIGIFRDCLDITCVVYDNVTLNNSVFAFRENPVKNEFNGPATIIDKGSDPGGIDNLHLSYHTHIHEPSALKLAAGCPECVHIHWRWGLTGFAIPFTTNPIIGGGPQFGMGKPLIPKNSNQTVSLAVTKNNKLLKDYHPDNKFTELLNSEDIESKDLIFWYSGTGYKEKDTFFTHGGFFGPDKSLNPPINKNNVRIAFAHLYEEGDTQVAQMSAAGLGTLPPGYSAYNDLAYDISTQAIVSGPHVITFTVPTITDPNIFNRLRVLHSEHEGHWVDVTILSPDSPIPDFTSKAISARVDSFSPFVIALVGETSDTIAPIITAPANISTANTANQCSASLNPGTATATDNIAVASLVGIRSDNKLLTEPYPVGVTTIIWTASDAAGNASSTPQTVTVNDTQPPVLTVPAAVTVNTDATNLTACNLFVSDSILGAATANDNCVSVTVIRSGVPAGNLFPVGTTTIIYTAKDLAGNITTATQLVTVLDKTPPIISCPANITTEFTGQAGAIVNFALPTATDNCGGQVTVTSSKASGSVFPLGVTTVLLTAKDAAGNTANCSFTVTVTGPRIVKQNVLNEMIALRVTVIDQQDRKKLDDAIDSVTASLTAALWLDAQRLTSKDSEAVFQKEKDAVNQLGNLLKDKKSVIADALLQGFMARLTRDDRQLAFVAISDALTAHGNAADIAKANDELAKGDAEVADGKHENAIERYRQAWKAALKAVGKG